jgi:hypothetical protein
MAKMTRSPNQGLSSNKLREVGQRLGTPAKGVQPGWASQLGMAKGDHTTKGDLSGKVVVGKSSMSPPAGGAQKLGNEMTMPYGPKGQGRTVYGQSGTNQQYGAANPGERKPITGGDPMSPWFGSNNAARRSAVKK